MRHRMGVFPALTIDAVIRHPLRSALLDALVSLEGREVTIAGLWVLLRAPQPAVSRAVARLARHGLVQTRHEGRHTLVRAVLPTPLRLAQAQRQARALAAQGHAAEQITIGLRCVGCVVGREQVKAWLFETPKADGAAAS